MNSRPPPPQGAPPSYAFVNRVYRRSLRPVVIGTCIIAALWSLIWGIASLRDISIDKSQAPKFVVFDIILGVLYLTICATQVFGAVAAQSRKVPLARLFAFAQLGAALIVLATAIIRVVLHFAFKNELIRECTDLATGDTITTRFGFWGPSTTTILDGEDAQRFCSAAWSRESFSEIIWLFVASILAFLFASVAYSYYRQLLDPTSVANMERRPNAATHAVPPAHYAPPYAGGYGGQYGGGYGGYEGYGQGPYAPPRGPPPMPVYDGAKLPEYDGNGIGGPEKERDLKDPFGDDERRDARGESSRDRDRD